MSTDAIREKIAELEMTSRMLADFSAVVSHDLQSALRRVATNAELLRLLPANAADSFTLASLSTILGATRTISRLIDDNLIARRRLASSTNRTDSVLSAAEDPEQSLQSRVTDLERRRCELSRVACSFADAICHPLTQILSVANFLDSLPGIALNPVGLDMSRSVLTGAKQMHKLLDDYLLFFNAERHAIKTSEVSMESLVQLVRHELEPEVAHRRVTWLIESLPLVHADAAMIRQVLLNLLSNALKYTRKCPEVLIEVGVQNASNETIFYVRDNGMGFDAELAQKLFKNFGRLHGDATIEGAGVGLIVVQHIIQRHGGRVWAEAAPGSGATFYFTIPHRGSLVREVISNQ